jgi:hypothetical protein
MRARIATGVLTLLGIAMACAPPPPPSHVEPPAIAPPAPDEDPPPSASVADAGATASDAGAREADASPPLGAELAWARSRWPKTFASIDTTPHAAALAGWVAPGAELRIWFTGDTFRCRPGVATRGTNESELKLVIYTAEKRTKAGRVREFSEGTAGHLLWFGADGGDEHQLPDGTWQQGSAWGQSDQTPLGVLSSVDANIARFDAMMIDISASCDGPTRQLACADGGSIACDTCQNVKLDVQERPMGMIRRGSVSTFSLRGGCTCPDVRNPDLTRAKLLFGGLDAWAPKPRGTGRTALYRSAAACKADK